MPFDEALGDANDAKRAALINEAQMKRLRD
jgi:hypothetical protein